MAEITEISIRCDRCGQTIACEIAGALPVRPIDAARIRVHVRGPQMVCESSRDLCVSCTSEFERFMKGDRLESGWVDPESLKPR